MYRLEYLNCAPHGCKSIESGGNEAARCFSAQIFLARPNKHGSSIVCRKHRWSTNWIAVRSSMNRAEAQLRSNEMTGRDIRERRALLEIIASIMKELLDGKFILINDRQKQWDYWYVRSSVLISEEREHWCSSFKCLERCFARSIISQKSLLIKINERKVLHPSTFTCWSPS